MNGKAIAVLALATTVAMGEPDRVDADIRQDVSDTIALCIEAIKSGDRPAASEFTTSIEAIAKEAFKDGSLAELVDLFGGNDAIACVSYGRQIKVAFVPKTGEYLTTWAVKDAQRKLIEQEIQRQNAELARQRARERARQVAEQEARDFAVSAKVYSSCSKLAARDEIAAFTNALCVESFRANGLP